MTRRWSVSSVAPLAAALVVGLLAVAWRPGPPTLAPDGLCPGLFDVLVVALLRRAPDWPVGQALAWVNGLALVAAVLALSRAARVASDSPAGPVASALAALTMGVVAVVGPSLPNRLAPASAALAVLFGSLVARQMAAGGGPVSWGRLALAGAVFVAAGVSVPPWLVPLGIGAAATVWIGTIGRTRPARTLIALASGGLVVLICAGGLRAANAATGVREPWAGLAPCALPAMDHVATRLASGVAAIVADAGPFLIALALAGAAGHWRQLLGPSRLVLAGVASLALAFGLVSPLDTSAAIGPAIVAVLCLGARGVIDVASAVRSPRLRTVTALAVCVLLVWLQQERGRSAARDDETSGFGHQRVTLRRFERLAAVLPAGAAIVEEDATTALFLRAVSARASWAAKAISIVPPRADAVGAAAGHGTVLALPRARQELQRRGVWFTGFEFTGGRADPLTGMAMQGVSRVAHLRPCAAITPGWSLVTGVTGLQGLALAAESDADAGPAVFYLGGDAPLDPEPVGWPARATRGLLVRQFDRAVSDDERQLSAARAEDGLTADAEPLRSRHVTRLVVWRTPGAPMSLAIRLRVQPAAVYGRLVDYARGGQSLALCPASLDPVEPLHTSRDADGPSK